MTKSHLWKSVIKAKKSRFKAARDVVERCCEEMTRQEVKGSKK